MFLAFAISLGLAPLLSGEIGAGVRPTSRRSRLTRIVVSETLIGGLIGFLGRIFFGALETLANAIAMAIGLSSPLAPPTGDEQSPAVASLISLGATMAFFLTDLHIEVLRGLVDPTLRGRSPDCSTRNSVLFRSPIVWPGPSPSRSGSAAPSSSMR